MRSEILVFLSHASKSSTITGVPGASAGTPYTIRPSVSCEPRGWRRSLQPRHHRKVSSVSVTVSPSSRWVTPT